MTKLEKLRSHLCLSPGHPLCGQSPCGAGSQGTPVCYSLV